MLIIKHIFNYNSYLKTERYEILHYSLNCLPILIWCNYITPLSHNVTDLTPNTTYTMTVMADNGISGNEENRSVSVNVTTNAIDVAIYNTIDPNTTTDTSPAVVTLVVALVAMWCMVGVMIVVLVVVGLVVMKKRKPNM